MKAMGKLEEAADLLIDLLAGKEIPSAEVLKKVQEHEISYKTMHRAKAMVGAKSRKIGKEKRWVMSVPECMKGIRFCTEQPFEPKNSRQITASGQISADWTSVSAGSCVGISGDKIEIPDYHPTNAYLRIKAGGFEIETDEHFPSGKLAELLRVIGGEAVC